MNVKWDLTENLPATLDVDQSASHLNRDGEVSSFNVDIGGSRVIAWLSDRVAVGDVAAWPAPSSRLSRSNSVALQLAFGLPESVPGTIAGCTTLSTHVNQPFATPYASVTFGCPIDPRDESACHWLSPGTPLRLQENIRCAHNVYGGGFASFAVGIARAAHGRPVLAYSGGMHARDNFR